MSYRKFNADHLFTGKTILDHHHVLITDEAGKVLDITSKQDAGDDIEFCKGLITPGFINSHCHLELSHLKNRIPKHTGLVDFVQQVMGKRNVGEAEKIKAMEQAEQEMYNSGIVAVGDICNTPDSISIKQKSRIRWHNFIEVSGFTDGLATKRLADIQVVASQWSAVSDRVSIVPHAPYSVSKTLFGLLNDITSGQLISIHNQENLEENKLYVQKAGGFLSLYKNFGIDISAFVPTGKTSFQSCLHYFTQQQSLIAVHNTFTNKNDLDMIGEVVPGKLASVHFCICPNANQYIENAMSPIDLFRTHQCDLLIGTDSLASNDQLNILNEIRTIQQETADIPLHEILQWATINGARALNMADTLGSFEKGKEPGIILIDAMDGLKLTSTSVARRLIA